ncbi:MAG: hypothetical protein JO306_01060 [Gemmatimonadetes bacterium]|nr:hypothetical protein [Gemmatimonadota bacterium]
MTRAVKLTLALFLVALGAAACVGQGKNAPAPVAATYIRVENQSWLDVDVYAVFGGTRRRLGLVNGNSSQTLRIPNDVVGIGRSLAFLVDPVGSSHVGTTVSEIYVTPGQEGLSLTVPPTMGR